VVSEIDPQPVDTVVRNIAFEPGDAIESDWINANVFKSAFFNAMSVLFPYLKTQGRTVGATRSGAPLDTMSWKSAVCADANGEESYAFAAAL
jgi:hypothetical protein